jgi:hypothetical protein
MRCGRKSSQERGLFTTEAFPEFDNELSPVGLTESTESGRIVRASGAFKHYK